MGQVDRYGTRNAATCCVLLVATLAALVSQGCNRHDGTAGKILDAHAAAFVECERREAELTERIEQQKREIRALASGQDAGDTTDNQQAIQDMLRDLASCRSEWEAGVYGAMNDAGIPQPESREAVSRWLESRGSGRADGAGPP